MDSKGGLGPKVQQKMNYKGKKKLEDEGFGNKPTRAAHEGLQAQEKNGF
jgi:hypothetical protein